MLNGVEAARVNARAIRVDPQRLSRRTILIVTSDEDFRAAVSRVLEGEGYDVVTAPHAGHAFLAALTRPRIDVMVSELTLDDMPGAALAATLRRHHPALRTLYIAERSTRECARILVRPFTRDELVAELSTIATVSTSSPS
jgi:DNA-binding response OmpR family regulator